MVRPGVGRAIRRGTRVLVPVLLIGGAVWGLRELPGRAASPGDEARLVDLPPDAAAVRQGRFETTLEATGRLRAHRTVSVVVPDLRIRNGEIKVVSIERDGAEVTQGQVICRFDDTEFRRELRQEQLQLEQLRSEMARSKADRALETRNTDAALKKLEEELRILEESNAQLLKQAKAQLAFDEANLKRAQTELDRKRRQAEERLIPREQVELAEIELRAKEFAVAKGLQDLKLQEDKAASTERQKRIELENAKVTAETAVRKTGDERGSLERRLRRQEREVKEEEENLALCTLRAPASGLLVLSRMWQRDDTRRATRVGDSVWPRRQLGEIPDLSKMVVVCRIPERDIAGVRVGAPARVRLEEDPDRPYRASVIRISSIAEEVLPWDTSGIEPGTRTFTVTLDLQVDRKKRLFPGMTANLEIITQRLPQALYLPKQCVFESGEGHIVYRWVTPASGPGGKGRFVATEVTPGLENKHHVVIRRGLKPGDRVAIRKPA
jgi:multidrug resistance efflux pump